MEEALQILKEIEFDTVEDFYERKKEIQTIFKKLKPCEKRVYKWYFFFQLSIVNYDLKSAMWDYVNKVGDDSQLDKCYEDFKYKKEQYHFKYILEENKKKI